MRLLSSVLAVVASAGEICHEIVMRDLYGDGWNGNELVIQESESKQLVLNTTLQSNFSGSSIVCLEEAVCYFAWLREGFFPSEVSWTLGGIKKISIEAAQFLGSATEETNCGLIQIDTPASLNAGLSLLEPTFSKFRQVRFDTTMPLDRTIFMIGLQVELASNHNIMNAQSARRLFWLSQSLLTVRKVHFYAGYSDTDGGGIYMSGDSNLTLIDCICSQHIAIGNGGFLYAENSFVLMTHTVFKDNLASADTGQGGALYLKNVKASLLNVTARDNVAIRQGGFALVSQSSLRIFDSIFTKNIASEDSGGVITILEGEVYIERGSFYKNSALRKGGAIYIPLENSGARLMILESTFDGQSADSGAAIYNYEGNLSVYNSSFCNGIGGLSAGAIENDGGDEAIIEYCTFENNRATNGGAITSRGNIYSDQNFQVSGFRGARVKIRYSFFINNQAELLGGAIHTSITPLMEITHCEFRGNAIRSEFLAETALGGSLYLVSFYRMTIDYCVFYNSTTLYSAGAVGAVGTQSDILYVKNSIFKANGVPTGESFFTADCEANSAPPHGGALQIRFIQEALISNTTFESNYATSGGAIFAVGLSTFRITENCSFVSNYATGDGAALYIESDEFSPAFNASIQGTHSFVNNTADRGSVIFGTLVNTVTIANVTIIENHAISAGTIYLEDTNTCEIYGQVMIRDNSASSAVSVYADRVQTLYAADTVLIMNNTADSNFALTQVKSALVSSCFESNHGSLFVLKETLLDVGGILATNNTAVQGSIFYVTENSNAEIIFTENESILEANFATFGTVLYVAPFGSVSCRGVSGLHIRQNGGFSGLFYASLQSTVEIANIFTFKNKPESIIDIQPLANVSIRDSASEHDFGLRYYLRALTDTSIYIDYVSITSTSLISSALIDMNQARNVKINYLEVKNTTYATSALSSETSVVLATFVKSIQVANSCFTHNHGTALRLEATESALLLSTLIFGTMLQRGVIAIDSTLNILNSTFNSNHGDGAVYLEDSRVAVTSATFLDNHAFRGAALLASKVSIIRIESTSFISNVADTDGGIFIEDSSSMALMSNIFANNHASRGAGVYLQSNGTVFLENGNTIFRENHAIQSGGAVFFDIFSTAEPELSSGIFIDNVAGYGPDIATPPVSLEFNTQDESYVIASSRNLDVPLAVRAYDKFGQQCATCTGQIRLSTLEEGVTLTGAAEITFNESGVAVAPENFRITYFVGSEITLFATYEALATATKVKLRNCILGEYINSDGTDCIVCNANDFYSLSLTALSCTQCPRNARCNGDNDDGAYLTANKGFWRSNFYSTNIRKCPFTDNCKGGVNLLYEEDSCRFSTSGPLCATCNQNDEDGKKRILNEWTGKCVTCSRQNRRIVVGIIIIVFLLMAVVIMVKLASVLTFFIKTLVPRVKSYIVFLQIVMQQLRIFARIIRFPQAFSSTADALSSVVTLNAMSWLSSSFCFEANHLVKMRIYTLVPLGLEVLILLFARCNHKWAWYLALINPYLVYTIVSESVLSTFRCDYEFRRDDGEVGDYVGSSYLEVDYSVACDSRSYRLSYIYAVLMVPVYPIGIALSFFVLLFPHRKRLFPNDLEAAAKEKTVVDLKSMQDEEEQIRATTYLQLCAAARTIEYNPDAAKRLETAVSSAARDFAAVLQTEETHLEFLFADYRRDRWWFEAFGECPRRLLLASVIPALYRSNDLALLYTTFLTAIIYTSAYDYLRPYVDEGLNRFSILLQGMLVAILFFTIVLYFEESCDDDSQSGCESAGWNTGAIGAVLIVLTVVVAPLEIVKESGMMPTYKSSTDGGGKKHDLSSSPPGIEESDDETAESSPASRQHLISCISAKDVNLEENLHFDVESSHAISSSQEEDTPVSSFLYDEKEEHIKTPSSQASQQQV